MGGDLRVGIIPTMAPYLLPKVLPRLREAFPEFKGPATEAQTSNITRMLKQGDLDATLLALPLGEENIQEVALCDEPFVLAVPADHPKADWEEVFTEDLEGEEVLRWKTAIAFGIRRWKSVRRITVSRAKTLARPA